MRHEDQGIEDAVLRLHGLGPALDPRRKGLQQVRRDLGVGIHHHHGVRETVLGTVGERVGERVALAPQRQVMPFEYLRAGGARHLRGAIAAVVGDDDHPKPGVRPVDRQQAQRGPRDAGFLVMRRDEHVETQAARGAAAARAAAPTAASAAAR